MSKKALLHIVHCIDTEGPFNEKFEDSIKRINEIFGLKLKKDKKILNLSRENKINFGPNDKQIKKMLSYEYLNYKNTWKDLSRSLDVLMNNKFRNEFLDDFKNGWVYSWHCVDHLNFEKNNPRNKVRGYGKIFHFYKKILKKKKAFKDELNWHYHPASFVMDSISSPNTLYYSYKILIEILCKRIIEDAWFPVVNRPGFHIERSDTNLFLEQWIPFDYANQRYDFNNDRTDSINGRFGDWSRAPKEWIGYHPDSHDYQNKGFCTRKIFRILNIGTRFNEIKQKHIKEAFSDAKKYGKAILAVCNHDYRDMKIPLIKFKKMILKEKNYNKNVLIKFSGAEEAATCLTNKKSSPIKFKINIKNNQLVINLVKGKLFGPQPFLAIKTKKNEYLQCNLDEIKKNKIWSIYFDNNTIGIDKIDKIGIGSAGKYGGYATKVINVK